MAKRSLTIAALIGLALLASGCASTAAYQTPISNFADAADKAATAFQALDADATAKLNDIRFKKALADFKVDYSGCKPQVTETGCAVTLFSAPGVPVYTADLMPNTVALFNGIRDYAKALDKLEKADATKDVQSAAANVLGTAATATGAINAAAGAAVATIREPAAAITGYAYGLYQDSIKRDAIRRAVIIMDGVIQEANAPVTKQLAAIQTSKLVDLSKAATAAIDAYNTDPTDAKLKSAIGSANVMDATIKVGLPDLYSKLATAHGKLKEAVVNPDADPVAFLDALSKFLQQAQNVKAIADALSKSGK